MKNIFALILIVLMAIMPVMAEIAVEEESIPEVYMIEGVVAQNDENGILVNTAEMGPVLVMINDETLWEGTETLEAGDYAYVDYNGMMTRALPGQINAMVIRSYRMEGTVTEVMSEENAMLISTETHGNVYVTLPAEGAPESAPLPGSPEAEAVAQAESAEEAASEEAVLPAAGDSVTVYFNGAMTMSLPGRINAGLVVIDLSEEA